MPDKQRRYYLVSNTDGQTEYVLAANVPEARKRSKMPGRLKDLEVRACGCHDDQHTYLPIDSYTPLSSRDEFAIVDQLIDGRPVCRNCFEHHRKPITQRVKELEIAVARINDELENR
jgi:hypothetical protein